MTPMAAIRSATVVAAELLGWQDRVGALVPGRLADVIAVPGDPLDDLELLADVPFVMQGVGPRRGRACPVVRRRAILSGVTSTTASGFVGRAEELDRLLGLLDRADRGRPAVGLIAGDAGVGKTRLLDELAARATDRGARCWSAAAWRSATSASLCALRRRLPRPRHPPGGGRGHGPWPRPSPASAGCCPSWPPTTGRRRRPGTASSGSSCSTGCRCWSACPSWPCCCW